MNHKLRKSLRRLGRKIEGARTLNNLIRSRSQRLGLPRERVERELFEAPQFTHEIDMSDYDGLSPFDQFLESKLIRDVPFDVEQFQHLNNAEVNQVVLYDSESIPLKRRSHLLNCDICNATVNSYRPSKTSVFEVEEFHQADLEKNF